MTDQIPTWLADIRAAETARTREQWHTSEMVPHIVCVGNNDYYVLKARRREDAAFAARATDPEHGLAALAENLHRAHQVFAADCEGLQRTIRDIAADRDALRQRVAEALRLLGARTEGHAGKDGAMCRCEECQFVAAAGGKT